MFHMTGQPLQWLISASCSNAANLGPSLLMRFTDYDRKPRVSYSTWIDLICNVYGKVYSTCTWHLESTTKNCDVLEIVESWHYTPYMHLQDTHKPAPQQIFKLQTCYHILLERFSYNTVNKSRKRLQTAPSINITVCLIRLSINYF